MALSDLFTKKDILDETFGFDRLQKLQHALAEQTGIEEEDIRSVLTAEDFIRFLDRKIISLRQRLVSELDHPSWGPKGSSKKAKRAEREEFDKLKAEAVSEEEVTAFASDPAVEGPDNLIKISQNLDQSERYFRFSWLYLGAALTGLMIVAGALFVDYQIMNEFWTRVLSNEFMEVPPSLANSVVSKSAQVIFATAAFHFFLSKLPDLGRTTFITVFFALTAVMITGFGFLNANISMPSDPESVMVQNATPEPTLNDALVAMGLAEPETPSVPEVTESVALETHTSRFASFGYLIEDAQPILWMLVPGLVFLVVTGIGALSLQVAEHNIQNFVKSLDYPKRKRREEELSELTRFRAVLMNMPETRSNKAKQPDVFTTVPYQGAA